MMFQVGDMFEKHGEAQYIVIFANDNYFVCVPVWLRDGEVPLFGVNHPEAYDNTGSLDEKYWIRKIDAYAGIYSDAKEL